MKAAKTWVQISDWAALQGSWTLGPECCVFNGVSDGDRLGLATGGAHFRQGTLRTEITLSRAQRTSAGVAFGLSTSRPGFFAVALGAFDRAYAILEARPSFGTYYMVAGQGSVANLEPGLSYRLEIQVRGQSVKVQVNGATVLSSALPTPIVGNGVALYAWDDAQVRFGPTSLKAKKPRLFVIMPYRERYSSLYRKDIKPIAKELGFKVVRADEVDGPGVAVDEVEAGIAEATAVLAEITDDNPNVYYELGYGRALQKPAVMVRHSLCGIAPFDVRGFKQIRYDESKGGRRTFRERLRGYLQAALDQVQ